MVSAATARRSTVIAACRNSLLAIWSSLAPTAMPEMAHGAMSRTSPASGVTPAASSEAVAAHAKKPAITDVHPTITFRFISAPFHVIKIGMRINGPPVPVSTDAQPTSNPTAANVAISCRSAYQRSACGMCSSSGRKYQSAKRRRKLFSRGSVSELTPLGAGANTSTSIVAAPSGRSFASSTASLSTRLDLSDSASAAAAAARIFSRRSRSFRDTISRASRKPARAAIAPTRKVSTRRGEDSTRTPPTAAPIAAVHPQLKAARQGITPGVLPSTRSFISEAGMTAR
mmetsp:Transcript_12647/g.53035  ORF Transcript_12647/g.53035 Transcript_12647/m.53035 type:complete len:286 (+) Transcript_12647:230-1087(+)